MKNMGKGDILEKTADFLIITLGSISFSLGISLFLSPCGLAAGGLSGIAIIINKLCGIPTGLLIFLMNIPLFIAGFMVMGKGFTAKTLYATALSSVLIDLEAKYFLSYTPLTEDIFPSAVAGAVLEALGIAIILRRGGSTGGTDIIVKFLRKKFRNIKTGSFILAVDLIIISASAIIFENIERALYAAIALYINSKIIDLILYGKDEAKLLVIISDRPQHIADRFMKELGIGVTFTYGSGGYTGNDKRVIICAVKNHAFHLAKDIVNETDTGAFMIVSSASEIFGEGYKMHGSEEL